MQNGHRENIELYSFNKYEIALTLTLSILNGFPNMCCLTGVDSTSRKGAAIRFKYS
jgi:hypothetical protein